MLMESLSLLKLPLDVARFVGRQMLGGGWADLPPLPQGEYHAPVRASASIQYYQTSFEIPDNVELGQE